MYVTSPWNQEYTFVPQGASVHMYCAGESALWKIRPSTSASGNFIDFKRDSSRTRLNSNGIHEGAMGNNSEAIHLIVRSGSINNGTVIRCVAGGGVTTIYETTLIVYGKELWGESDAIVLLTSETINVCTSLISYHGHGCLATTCTT